MKALRVGRMIALQKPDGGARGIVAGDVFRRLVSRTMAQQLAQEIQKATSPFQYALSTRAGVECIFHMLEALTAEDDQRTIISIDGIGAFDSISRASMLSKLIPLGRASRILPFVKLFYGEPSEYIYGKTRKE